MQQKSHYHLGPVTGGLGISRSVMISRPSYRPSLRLAMSVLLVLAAFVLLWVVSQNRDTLARELPDSARWYARLPLPREVHWYDSFLLREQAMERTSAAGELVASLDVLHWEGASFADAILPLISGSLEVAELADGQVVLAAALSDQDGWFALMGDRPDAQESIREAHIPLQGLWRGIAPQSSEWAWMVREGRLYVASSASAFGALGKGGQQTLAMALSEAGSRGREGVWYVLDAESAPARNPYAEALLQGAQFPLALDIAFSEGNVIFSTQKSPGTVLSSAPASGLAAMYAHMDVDAGLYAARIGDSQQWFSALSDGARLKFDAAFSLLEAWYGADRALFSSVEDAELAIFFFRAPDGELDWLAALSDDPEGVLARVGEALFAASHPKAVPQTLADGSPMVELRAERAGIAWEPLLATYNGAALEFSSLAGAGELRAYARGAVPGLGMVLTNNVSMLNRVRVSGSPAASGAESNACGGFESLRAGFWVSGGLFENAFPQFPFVTRVTVSDGAESGVAACLETRTSSSS
ncbi:MAG: hypothetical protein HY473_02535 [Candidatus Sungbacteria bacterium]|uniref:Uncharacterized protein n=1 Tax=Candidatus Sungiibacteriota bacterium TaxID=2750080 RepID=A0A932YZ87_9BACT|nr:hypothetical protein [Parcubacteria group bacterium]MBI2636975.1 hypothetical protein [Parcubacteria group bacterium]MBI4132938.1 hypothetical protein [Candidatus Sungbacteria bacterium]